MGRSHRNLRQPDHIAVTGYRGAVIRPAVLNRLPELATQATLYPTVITSGGNMGIVAFVPSPDGDPTVIFGAYPMVVDDNLTADIAQLNEKGHAATWPFARFDASGRAFIAWIDAASGRKSNVALRSSTNDSMMKWTPIPSLSRLNIRIFVCFTLWKNHMATASMVQNRW